MAADPFYSDPGFAALYDITCTPDRPDFARCRILAKYVGSVLDLGCGTGGLAVDLARSVPRVVGVEPAQAMLDVARARPGSERVVWIEADATQLDLEERFDLILMTGNAFQCLPEIADQQALFEVVARHLSPSGLFVFDTRNPAGFVPWTRRTSERRIRTTDGSTLRWWASVPAGQSLDSLLYLHHYEFGDAAKRTVASVLRFTAPGDLTERLSGAGLQASLCGGWSDEPFTDTSADIVVFARASILQ